MALTILGGHGFVGKHYVFGYYDQAVGNIASVNERADLQAHSPDMLYFISTVTNHNIFTDLHVDINTNLNLLVDVLSNWRDYQVRTGEGGVFNFISSWSVYGNQAVLPVPETAVCDPKGFYIITKRCAEQLLVTYCETFGLKYRILRLANAVGPGDRPSAKKNVLQHSINLLKENQDVELFGNGDFYRDFIHVKDCVDAIETVLNKGAANEIYNIGNGRPCMTYGETLEYVRTLLGSTGKIVYKEPTEFQRTTPVASFYMDVNKLAGLGFRPRYTEHELFYELVRNS